MQKQTKMLQFRRAFENEQIQLQDLNARLRQYLSRVKELEQDNALLIKEINATRQDKTQQWEKQYLPELRELRMAVNKLTLEKCAAEMDRERLGRELKTIQALRCEETGMSRDIAGERKDCEKQLQQACKKNAALEEHLLQLEDEFMRLQDAHSQDIAHLRKEVHSRALPIAITQNYQGHPAVTMEEMEAYAQIMSESLNENFEVYCRRIEVLEDSIKANQANLEDLHREKTRYASELKKLHAEAQKQSKLQLHLEDQLMQLQDQFHLEASRYQAIIGELEDERRLLAHAITEKLKEYQQLTQVKMGLGLEVATYRALLEGERKEPIQKMDQYAREASRKIDIKMPSQPWSTTTRHEVQKQYSHSTGPQARYTNLASNLKASFGSSNIRPTSPARVVPISTHERYQRSAPARRDMPSFTKPSLVTTNFQKTAVEERSVRKKEPLQKPAIGSTSLYTSGFAAGPSSGPAPKEGKTTVVTTETSTESTVVMNGKGGSKPDLRGHEAVKREGKEDEDANKVTVKEWMTPDRENVRTSNQVEGSSGRLPATMSVQKIIVEEQTVKTTEVPQKPAKDSADQHQPGFTTRLSPEPAPLKDKTTIVITQTESIATVDAKADGDPELRGPKVDKTEGRDENVSNNVTLKEWTTPDWEDVKVSSFPQRLEVQIETPEVAGSSETLPAASTVQKTIMEESIVRTEESLQNMMKDSASECQRGFAGSPSPEPVPTKGKTTVFMTSTENTFVVNGNEESKHGLRGDNIDQMEGREEHYANKINLKEWMTPDWEAMKTSNIPERVELHSDDPGEATSSDEQMVDYIYMEEILEEVMRPAGLDSKFKTPAPDSKVAYRVERTEDEDGKTKTQITLESRVEQDLDINDDSFLLELLSKGVKKISLEDIKGTPTGSAIENLLSLGHHIGGSDLEHKSVNVEIIEEPAEDHGGEEGEAFFQPSSMFCQIEELDDAAKLPGVKTSVSKPTPTEDTEYQKEGSLWVREGYREVDDPFSSHAQDYFVSTPDEEERGISSYGHYGVLDDLSDERYYQEDPPINPRFEEDKENKLGLRGSYITTELGFTKDRFPECIIEEEVHVSPTVQETRLDLQTEDSMDLKQHLRGDLDKLQENVLESLQDELAHVIKNVPGGPKKLSVDVKEVQEVADNGTVTITAELRHLDDSDSLEDSESDIGMLASSHPDVQHATDSKTVREYTVKIVSTQDAEPLSVAPTASLNGSGVEGFHGEESANGIHKTEKVIKLGPSERSLTFQMDIGNFGSATSLPVEGGAQEFKGFFSQSLEAGGPTGGEGVYTYVQKTTVSEDYVDMPTHGHDHEEKDDLTEQQVECVPVLQTQFVDPQLKVSHEKRILYLDSTEGN